jgi:DNA-binding transcriptional LysR family regulator
VEHALAGHDLASGIPALGLVAAGLGVTVVAASYQALTLDGVRFVPVTGHQLTLQIAWAARNTSTALPGFLDTARQIAGQPIPARPSTDACNRPAASAAPDLALGP